MPGWAGRMQQRWCCLTSAFCAAAVAKPLVADGTAKSHAMALAYDERSLATLEPPLVLQEFVNHGETPSEAREGDVGLLLPQDNQARKLSCLILESADGLAPSSGCLV